MWYDDPQNRRYNWRDDDRDDSWRGQLSGLLALGIFCIWMFWCGQMSINQKPPTDRQLEQQEINRKVMVAYSNPILARAEKMGHSYGPKQYYADLRCLHLKNKQLSFPRTNLSRDHLVISGKVERLLHLLEYNQWHFGNKQAEEFARERWREQVKFQTWQAKYCPQEGIMPGIRQALHRAGWLGVLAWFVIFYLRSIVMMMLIYLFRIARRDGLRAVLPTIWKQKVRFVIASILWIAFFWRYPHNVLRELWVEIQLRRLGGFLKHLTPAERQKIRQVAAMDSAGYKSWMIGFKTNHAKSFQRGVLWAIVGLILLRAISFGAAFGFRSYLPIRAPVQVTIEQTRGDPGAPQAGQTDSDGGGVSFILPDVAMPKPVLILLGRITEVVYDLLMRLETVTHVPIRQLAFRYLQS